MDPIPARFPSRCLLCDRQIYEGDDIVKIEDSDWVHYECAVDEGLDDDV